MTESKLKPCPFCGGEAEYDEDFFGRAYIQCSNCEAHLQDKKAYQDDVQELINKYNKIVEDILKDKEEELMTI